MVFERQRAERNARRTRKSSHFYQRLVHRALVPLLFPLSRSFRLHSDALFSRERTPFPFFHGNSLIGERSRASPLPVNYVERREKCRVAGPIYRSIDHSPSVSTVASST